MKNKTLCLVGIFSIGLCLLAGCGAPAARTNVYGVYTFDDNGHKFIVYARGGLLHHPDCQCFKQK